MRLINLQQNILSLKYHDYFTHNVKKKLFPLRRGRLILMVTESTLHQMTDENESVVSCSRRYDGLSLKIKL